MRAVRLSFVAAACLLAWLTPVVGLETLDPPEAAKVIGGDQVEEKLFYDEQFVYVPPPTPDLAPNPKFYAGRFRVALPADLGSTSASPPSQTAKSAAVSVVPNPATPTPTASYGTVATTAVQNLVPASPTATPTALPIAKPAIQQPVVQTSAPAPTPFVLGAEADPRFHEGGFRYTAPATPPPIEDPRFYRGSFTIDEAGHLAPASSAGTTTVTPVQKPVVQPAAPANKDVYTVPSAVTYDRLSPSYTGQSPLPVRGRAMYYNPGIMAEVLSYRLQLNQVQACGNCVGYVALLRAGDINRKVWLQWDDGTVEGPFLVIDVAAKQHVPSLLARDWVVDVDYRTAMRRRMYGPVPVTVLAAPTQASVAGSGVNNLEPVIVD